MIKTHRQPALLTDSFIGNFNELMNEILNDNSKVSKPHKQIGINFIERENGYIVEAALPGFNRQEIKVSLEDHLLTISATKEKSTVEEKDKNHLVEIPYGAFTRKIQLPKNTDSNSIDATYEQGILKLHIAKRKESLVKTIEIK